MRKPTPEDFGLNDARVREIEAWHRDRDARFGCLTFLAVVVAAMLLGIREDCRAETSLGGCFAVAVVSALVGLWPGVMVGILVARLYGKIAAICSPGYRAVQRFKAALAQYEAWWHRTQQAFWRSLSGPGFEQELAALYRRLGYTASISGGAGDEGIDIVLTGHGKRVIVQCKAHRKPVGPAAARELYGTLVASRADEAILASLSGFTRAVERYVQGKRIRLLRLDEIINMQRRLAES